MTAAHVEYDLGVAAKERDLRNVELIDYAGDPVKSFEWKPQYVSFKIMLHNGSMFRFLYVFQRRVYYQQSDILDIDEQKAHKIMTTDPYELEARMKALGLALEEVRTKRLSLR